MKLSVVIVNYNVKHFLEQCLFSVMKAAQNIDIEIFVVDNNSVDGSCNMVNEKFPNVKLIENKENKGFSYANNQAIRQSKGEYVLLLNPDTVIEENTFSKVVYFMESHPDAGGLGVKMIDGKGHFLPESKRGLPTPMVAFYKIFGLSKLFPKSKIFGKYHLGFLDKEKNHTVDVLSGAFMMLRKSVLEKTGLLDESFFMYGEDIDLSYRITKAGYKNYYFSETAIIHYKGESTKKGSVNYVLVFYKAMIIFAQKHFTAKNAKLYSILISFAIYFRAFMAILSRFIQALFIPFLDATLIYCGFYLIKPFWENYKFSGQGSYPPEYLNLVVPSYILIWLISIFFIGGYDKPIKLIKMIKGVLVGTLIILIIYSLLGEELRFSRALILIGTFWTFVTIILLRLFLHLCKIKGYSLKVSRKRRVVIVGYKEEIERITSILCQTDVNPLIIGAVCPVPNQNDIFFIGDIHQIREIIRINSIDEIIYSAKDIASQVIINNMLELSGVVDYKIASPDSISVIGSNSIDTAGDLYTINLNMITKAENKRNKRLLDVLFSLFFITLSPVFIIFVYRRTGFFFNIFSVLAGFNSWVGYKTDMEIQKSEIKSQNPDLNPKPSNFRLQTENLPKIKKGILNPSDLLKTKYLSCEIIDKINTDYAKDYKVINDFNIILKNFKNIGR